MRKHWDSLWGKIVLLAAFAGNPLIGLLAARANSEGPEAKEGFRPNILWLTSEDNGPHLGCYGDTFAYTPKLDALAARGMRYLNAWSNAPVCAPARTTIISGMYPTTLGAQHMRSSVPLPANVKLIPQLMRELGYYCCNNSKTDYNLAVDHASIWDDSSNRAHWRNRRAGQPFFAVFNSTITHESKLRTRPHQAVHDPVRVPLPPYHPDTPEVRQDWAQYYDRISEMDRELGGLLDQLRADGLDDSTIVFYFADHGSGMPRSKRWLYESGLRVPMIVHIPERIRFKIPGQYEAGGSSQRLVSFIDLVPTMLSLVGVSAPDHLPGNAFLGVHAKDEPPYLYGFRDRMDERYDMSRAVRDEQYSYIRNFLPHRPQGTYLAYMFETPTTRVWKRMHDQGNLNETQNRFWVTKNPEELHDLKKDPHQIHNLAGEAEHAETLMRLRKELRDWMLRTGDLGLLPEGEMLKLAQGESPQVLGQNNSDCPLEEILTVAEMATNPRANDLDELLEGSVATNSMVRYWVAQGILLRAVMDQERAACVKAARSMLNDNSPYVSALAAETLNRFGGPEHRGPAMNELLRLADPRSQGVLAAMAALNSLAWSEPSAAEIGNSLEGVPSSLPHMDRRYESYVGRMIQRIQSQTSNSSSADD